MFMKSTRATYYFSCCVRVRRSSRRRFGWRVDLGSLSHTDIVSDSRRHFEDFRWVVLRKESMQPSEQLKIGWKMRVSEGGPPILQKITRREVLPAN